MRYRFKTEYDGREFAGWQIQPQQRTVQSVLESAFETVLRQKVRIFGSGRTDAGVHARGQVAQIDFDSDLPLEKICRGVNALLPNSVAVRDLQTCSQDFSARFDALSRYYIYTIAKGKRPLHRERAWNQMNYVLDIESLCAGAANFVGEHDFKDFCIPRDDDKSTLCTLTRCDWVEYENRYEVHIVGNRFLHRMVRAIVGALIEIGRGRYSATDVSKWLDGTRQAPRIWAPPDGLVLEKVEYVDY